MSSSSHDRDDSTSFADNMNLLLFVCWIWSTAVEVFLHRTPGDRYLGFQAAAVLLLVPLFTLGWEGHDVRPLLCFVPAYLLMCVIARIGMFRRRWRGERCHSMYSGWPRMMGRNAKVSEETFKRFFEPLLVLVLGLLLRLLGEAPLGTFLMLAAVCLFISVSATASFAQTRAMDMNDAVILQERLAERFRQLRGED